MSKKTGSLFVFLSLFLLRLPKKGLAKGDSIKRSDVLDVAKEIHPPGCLDSRTADYCQLSTAYEVRGEIQGLLEQGMNKGQVIDTLVQKYGERILASPPVEGFNLIPWILPGLGILTGSILIVFLIYKWAKKRPKEVEEIKPLSSITKEEERKINEELKEWI